MGFTVALLHVRRFTTPKIIKFLVGRYELKICGNLKCIPL